MGRHGNRVLFCVGHQREETIPGRQSLCRPVGRNYYPNVQYSLQSIATSYYFLCECCSLSLTEGLEIRQHWQIYVRVLEPDTYNGVSLQLQYTQQTHIINKH